jgi:SAM-dependent methyltransferase
MSIRRPFILVALAGIVALAACGSNRAIGQSAPFAGATTTAPAPKKVAVFPKPQRPIASIVTNTWSDEAARDNARVAETVIRLLDIRHGMTVADIGAGSGYYVMRIAPVVGPTGRVYAEDIVPDYVDGLSARVQRAGLGNVTVLLGEPDNPRLPSNSIDLALLVHMYHEVQQPFALLHNLHASLKPGARVAIIDADRPTSQHGTPPDLLSCELAAVGYRQIAFHKLGRVEGYLAVFAPPGAGELPRPEAIRSCGG